MDGSPSVSRPHATRDLLVDALDRLLQRAADQAAIAETDPVTAVHEYRKALRRSRSLLRLVRAALSRRAFRRLDLPLKTAHRATSRLRDAEIIACFADAPNLSRASNQLRELVRARRRSDNRLERARTAQMLRRSMSSLRDIPRTLADALPKDLALGVVLAGHRRSYRRARRELDRVRHIPDQTHLHNWRKRNKDVAYQLELLAPYLGSAWAADRRERMAALSKQLGEITDLFVLRRFLAELPEDVSGASDVSRRTRRQARKQVAEAVRDGGRLYARAPRKYSRRLRRQS